nr:uncharacterized protein LOC129442299 isoform X3 [Misgurnus anguillicaudatus]
MWKEGPVCRHNGTKLGKFPAFNLPISSDAVNVKSRRLGVALESITTGSEVEGLIRVMRSNSRKKVGAPPCFDQDSSVHFAVYCQTDHGEYWDNNDGQNYTLKMRIP